jgi:hypothetical protein
VDHLDGVLNGRLVVTAGGTDAGGHEIVDDVECAVVREPASVVELVKLAAASDDAQEPGDYELEKEKE